MKIDAHSIKWPNDADSCMKIYLDFLIESLRVSGVDLPHSPNSALEIARLYLLHEISDADRLNAGTDWWEFITSAGGVFDFESKEILLARLSLCLLTGSGDEASDLSESLNWYVSFLEHLGVDTDPVYRLMKNYFEFI